MGPRGHVGFVVVGALSDLWANCTVMRLSGTTVGMSWLGDDDFGMGLRLRLMVVWKYRSVFLVIHVFC
jgi:hypothetical protein